MRLEARPVDPEDLALWHHIGVCAFPAVTIHFIHHLSNGNGHPDRPSQTILPGF